jgi:hypothetical protein
MEWIAMVALVFGAPSSKRHRSKVARQDITLQLGVAGREVDLRKGLQRL